MLAWCQSSHMAPASACASLCVFPGILLAPGCFRVFRLLLIENEICVNSLQPTFLLILHHIGFPIKIVCIMYVSILNFILR